MLFPSDSVRERISQLISQADTRSVAGLASFGRQILDIDPEFAIGYFILGQQAAETGELDQAEAHYWKAVQLSPAAPTYYMALGDLIRGQRPGDPLGNWMMRIAFRKLGAADEIPEAISQSYLSHFETAKLDFSDPTTFEMISLALDHKEGELQEPAGYLRPYRWLTDLQVQAPGVVDAHLLDTILEHADLCRPVFHRALREWARKDTVLGACALELLVAILGEIGDPDVVPDLVEVSHIDKGNLFLHGQWAVMRMAQRFPREALSAFRRVGRGATAPYRCLAAEQLALMPASPDRDKLLLELLEDFSAIAKDDDAAFLVMVVSDAFLQSGNDAEAERIATGYGDLLPRKQRRFMAQTIASDEGFIPKLQELEIEESDIRDVCLERVFMLDEDEDDEEDDDELPEEDEEDDQEPSAPPAVRPGRNDPCWCGSGKKYKKCHLDEDERGDRDEAPPDTPRHRLMMELMEAGATWRGSALAKEAFEMYFGRPMSSGQPAPHELGGFSTWALFDYRPRPGARTIVEEYLHRRGGRIDAAEREMLEAWRDSSYGLYELQRVEPGHGVQLRNLFDDESIFVHDISASRELSRWDSLLARLDRVAGRYEFSCDGTLVPRPLLPQLREFIEDECEEAGQSTAEFVRANSHRLHRVVRDLSNAAGRPKIVTPEGDPLEFCNATYQVLNEAAAVAALAGVEGFERDGSELAFAWLGPGDDARRSFGRAEIKDGTLRLECNSRPRLERGRGLIEAAAAAHLKHLRDEFTSVKEAMKAAKTQPRAASAVPALPPEAEREIVSKYLDQHYATWPDTVLPALDGRTPRAAIGTPEGRRAVLALIHDFENAEERNRHAGRPAYDFSRLRSELGFGPDE